ncbi:hypothetical protein AB4X16_05695 [Edwardsiella tarda]|uniref:hypothetical protein n=1 Tax=Edwardsiella tarda TaxID=636 RepID=UPI0034DD86F8
MFSLITSAIGIIKNVLALFSKNKSNTQDVSTNDLNMAEIQKGTGKGWRFYLGCVVAFVLLWLYVIHPYLCILVYHYWGLSIIVPPMNGIFSVLLKLL